MLKDLSKIILTILILPLGFLIGLTVITAYIIVLPAVILITGIYLANFLSSMLHDEPIDDIQAKPFSLEKFIAITVSVIPAAIVVSIFTVLGAPIFLIICTGAFSYNSSKLIVDKVTNSYEDVVGQVPIDRPDNHFQRVEMQQRKAAQPYSTYDLSFFQKPKEEMVSKEEIISRESSNQIKLNFLQNRKAPKANVEQGEHYNPRLN